MNRFCFVKYEINPANPKCKTVIVVKNSFVVKIKTKFCKDLTLFSQFFVYFFSE